MLNHKLDKEKKMRIKQRRVFKNKFKNLVLQNERISQSNKTLQNSNKMYIESYQKIKDKLLSLTTINQKIIKDLQEQKNINKKLFDLNKQLEVNNCQIVDINLQQRQVKAKKYAKNAQIQLHKSFNQKMKYYLQLKNKQNSNNKFIYIQMKKITLDDYLRDYGYPSVNQTKSQNNNPYPKTQNIHFPQRDFQKPSQYIAQSTIKHPFKYEQPFSQSKSECLHLINQLKQLLNIEKDQMKKFTEQYYKMIHQDFLQQHQNLKNRIMQMLDRYFVQSQERIKQVLIQKGNITPKQFINIYSQLQLIQNELNTIQEGLHGSEYKSYIAKTVTQQFDFQIQKIRKTLLVVQSNFKGKMVDIQINQDSLRCIQKDLKNIFLYVQQGSFKQEIIPSFDRQQKSHFYLQKTSPLIMQKSKINAQKHYGINSHQNRDKLKLSLFPSTK